MAADTDSERPFDHGAWVPLMHLFPQATVPVVQVALAHGAGPAEVLALGQALLPLRAQGVLVIGTGSMTHNLGEFFRGIPPLDSPAAPYVGEFSRWVEAAITRHDVATLLDYRRQALKRKGAIAQSVQDHERIVAALATGDPVIAEDALGHHLQHVHKSTVQEMAR